MRIHDNFVEGHANDVYKRNDKRMNTNDSTFKEQITTVMDCNVNSLENQDEIQQ
jgi:hypothetical protein